MHLPLRVFTVQWRIPQNTARTDRGFHHRAKYLQTTHFYGLISGRYLWERSVSIPWRSIAYRSTDRTKVLQMDTLKTVRAMRAIVCDVLLARLAPLPSPQFSRID